MQNADSVSLKVLQLQFPLRRQNAPHRSLYEQQPATLFD
jgi:hypothetical protein